MEKTVIHNKQIIDIHIQTRLLSRMKLPAIIQQKTCLTHTTASLHGNQPATAVNRIQQSASDGEGSLFQKSRVCCNQTVHISTFAMQR